MYETHFRTHDLHHTLCSLFPSNSYHYSILKGERLEKKKVKGKRLEIQEIFK